MISARWNLAVGPVLMLGGAFVTVVGLTLLWEVCFLLFFSPEFFLWLVMVNVRSTRWAKCDDHSCWSSSNVFTLTECHLMYSCNNNIFPPSKPCPDLGDHFSSSYHILMNVQSCRVRQHQKSEGTQSHVKQKWAEVIGLWCLIFWSRSSISNCSLLTKCSPEVLSWVHHLRCLFSYDVVQKNSSKPQKGAPQQRK